MSCTSFTTTSICDFSMRLIARYSTDFFWRPLNTSECRPRPISFCARWRAAAARRTRDARGSSARARDPATRGEARGRGFAHRCGTCPWQIRGRESAAEAPWQDDLDSALTRSQAPLSPSSALSRPPSPVPAERPRALRRARTPPWTSRRATRRSRRSARRRCSCTTARRRGGGRSSRSCGRRCTGASSRPSSRTRWGRSRSTTASRPRSRSTWSSPGST